MRVSLVIQTLIAIACISFVTHQLLRETEKHNIYMYTISVVTLAKSSSIPNDVFSDAASK